MGSFRIGPESRLSGAMVRIALPNLAEEFLMLLVGWTDWYLAGHYIGGDASKAAMGLLGYFMWLLASLFGAISIGSLALVARHHGAGDSHGSGLVARQSLLLGLLFAGLLTLLLALYGRQLTEVMQLDGEAAGLAAVYLAIIVPVVPLFMIEKVGGACLHGSGDTVTGFIARIVIVAINLIVSFTLVTGSFGFEKMGWVGLAYGTATGHLVGSCLIAGVLLSRRSGLWRGSHGWLPDKKVIRRILNVGLPAGMDTVAMLGGQLVFLGMINSLGTAAAAAHSLAIQIEACAYLPGAAFQVAAASMTGQLLGAGDARRARKGALLCLIVGGSIICLSGFLMFVWGQNLAAFFAGSGAPETTADAARLLRVVAFAMPFLATVMILGGALRGAGDTRVPFVYTMVGLILVRLPLTMLLCFADPFPLFESLNGTGFGLGVIGGWYAMWSDLFVRCLLVANRFFQGNWIRSI